MKVLFSNPPWWEDREWNRLRRRWRQGVRAGSRWPFTYVGRSKPDKFRMGDYLPYPFFMAYAAAYSRQHTDAQVVMRDSIARRESMATYMAYLQAEQFDYVFLESATPSWTVDRQLVIDIHELLPQSRIVLTGPITSTHPQQLLDTLPVYACIQGEYEKGSVLALQGTGGVIKHSLLSKDEMNQAPFPIYDEACAHHYYDNNPRGQLTPQAQVWSSRGCPFKCIFCVWPATMTGNDPDGQSPRTVRHYTSEYMEAYLKEIVARHGFRCIYFDDDTFNLGNSHVTKMCEVMRGIGLPWSAMCRADTIKKETWAVMRESGCFGVKLGFESGSQRVVDTIVNKHLDLGEAREVVLHLKTLGFTVHGTFTYGLPGETREDMLMTKKFIKDLPFDSVQESGTAEIEGTPLATLRAKGSLAAYSGAHMDQEYRREVDGNKKMQLLVNELKTS